jgi:hypothetical protein
VDLRKIRRTFVVTLRAEPGANVEHALRGFLKLAGRRYGLRCVGIREELPQKRSP